MSLSEVQCAIFNPPFNYIIKCLTYWWFMCTCTCVSVWVHVCLCKGAEECHQISFLRHHSLHLCLPSLRFQAKATSSGLFHMDSKSWTLTCTPSTLLTMLSPKSLIIIVSVLPSFSIPILKTLSYDHLDLRPIINTFGLFFFLFKDGGLMRLIGKRCLLPILGVWVWS